MGLYDQIYQTSMRFRRDLLGGQRRPGKAPRTSSAGSAGAGAQPARFRCPLCGDPVPPAVTCSRCDVFPVDALGRYRWERAEWRARRRRRRWLVSMDAERRALPLVPIEAASGAGGAKVRVRARISQVLETVEGCAAFIERDDSLVGQGVGRFVVDDGTARLLVGVRELRIATPRLARGSRLRLSLGDEVEIVGPMASGTDGAYRDWGIDLLAGGVLWLQS